MPLYGLVVGMLAQTCMALLPPPQAEIEWFRDGQPYARDIPLQWTRTERVYRREHAGGRAAERVVSCVTTKGVTYFSDRVGSAAAVRIPVALKQGIAQVINRATVRRVAPPTGGSTRALWFAISNPGMSLYALQASTGVIEIRSPAPSGGFSVLRAVPRAAAPAIALAAADSQRRALEQRIAELEQTVRVLSDSIILLQPRAPPDSVRPYSADEIERMLREGVQPDRILAYARRSCLAFRIAPELEEMFVRAGAPATFATDLRGACVRAPLAGQR